MLLLLSCTSLSSLLGGGAPSRTLAKFRSPAVTQPQVQQEERRPFATTPDSRVWVEGRDLVFASGEQQHVLLQGVSKSLNGAASPPGFFSLSTKRQRSKHEVSLGVLRCDRLLSAARTKRWWMGPSFGSGAADVPGETQFLLCEVGSAYALLMPLVEGGFRCTLSGSGSGLKLLSESGDARVRTSEVSNALYVGVGDDPFTLVAESMAAVAERLGTFQVKAAKRPPADRHLFGWCTWDAFYQSVDPAGIQAGLRSLSGGGAPPRMLIIDDGWQTVADDPGRASGGAGGGSAGGASAVDAAASSGLAAGEAASEAAAAGAAAAGAAAGDDYVAGDESTLNNPTLANDTNAVVDWVCNWYRDHVDGADRGAIAVRLWRGLALTLLRPTLKSFFAEQTTFSKRLSAFRANGKFEDPSAGRSLRSFVQSLRGEFGPLRVYCWHTLGGYWGGVCTSSPLTAHLAAAQHFPRPTDSLLEVEPALGWDAAAVCGVGAVGEGREIELFHGIHSYLAESGVDGVKVDAQSGLGPLGCGFGGGPRVVSRHVGAMEASVGEHFRGNRCINCMCHSSENLYHYRETSLLRAADDFYPDEPAAQPVHLAHVSYNSLFLGEIGHVDWDMFTSTHSDAHMHAAARAVGGCPIYVSDQPGEHDFDLLRTLVLPDGTALLARHAGRPTRDVLFSDVNADGVSALKIWNENACTGVVGAFNVQGARWDRATRRFEQAAAEEEEEEGGGAVTALLRPADVAPFGRREIAAEEGEDGARGGGGSSPAAPPPAEYALYTHRAEGLRVLGAEDAVEVRLAAREWEIVVVAPVRAEGEVRWAPLGLLDMLNGGGAVLSSSLALSSPPGEAAATAVVRAAGRIGAFARPAPLEVCVDGSPVRFEYDEGSGLLTVNVAADGAEVEPLELRARWGPPAEEEEEEQQS